jgi:hypothetical protein
MILSRFYCFVKVLEQINTIDLLNNWSPALPGAPGRSRMVNLPTEVRGGMINIIYGTYNCLVLDRLLKGTLVSYISIQIDDPTVWSGHILLLG